MIDRTTDRRTAAEKLFAVVAAVTITPRPHLSAIATAAALPMSTTHRLLGELVAGRWLTRDESRLYRVGPAVLRLVPEPTTVRLAVAELIAKEFDEYPREMIPARQAARVARQIGRAA